MDKLDTNKLNTYKTGTVFTIGIADSLTTVQYPFTVIGTTNEYIDIMSTIPFETNKWNLLSAKKCHSMFWRPKFKLMLWEESLIYAELQKIKDKLSTGVANRIIQKKSTRIKTINFHTGKSKLEEYTVGEIWLPSIKEITGHQYFCNDGEEQQYELFERYREDESYHLHDMFDARKIICGDKWNYLWTRSLEVNTARQMVAVITDCDYFDTLEPCENASVFPCMRLAI